MIDHKRLTVNCASLRTPQVKQNHVDFISFNILQIMYVYKALKPQFCPQKELSSYRI